MLSYPLELRLEEDPWLLRATDATGRQTAGVGGLVRPYQKDVTVYEDEDLRKVRFHIEDEHRPEWHDLMDELKDLRSALEDWRRGPPNPKRTGHGIPHAPQYVIRGSEGRRLGTFDFGGGLGAWEVLWRDAYDLADTSGRRVGRVYRENPFGRTSYLADLRGRTAMRVGKVARFPDRYEVERAGHLADEDEELLLAGIILTFLHKLWRG